MLISELKNKCRQLYIRIDNIQAYKDSYTRDLIYFLYKKMKWTLRKLALLLKIPWIAFYNSFMIMDFLLKEYYICISKVGGYLCKSIGAPAEKWFFDKIIAWSNPDILEKSRIFGSLKAGVTKVSKRISSITLIKSLNIKLSLPIEAVSIIICVLILSSIPISIILKQKIGTLGWIVRAVLLLAGWQGLSCNADWKTIKNGSLFLKWVNLLNNIRLGSIF